MPRLAGFHLTEEHKRRIGLANWRGGRHNNSCVDCGKKIKNSSTRCRLCSNKKKSGENHYKYRGGKPICIDCGERTKDYQSTRCKKCMHLFMKLENHPNWMGGKTFEEYGEEFNNALREKIRTRDGHKCKMCGVHQMDCIRKLNVHHIDYDKKNNSSINLVSLCVSCHTTTNHDREFWRSFFSYGV